MSSSRTNANVKYFLLPHCPIIALNLSNIFPTQLTLNEWYRYKLPITITDDTGSIDVIAFSLIAQDLVERSAYHASQNMKIEATDHVVALQKAIGKTRLFHIGMSTNNSSNFSIRYVLRKCFEVNDSTTNSQVQNP